MKRLLLLPACLMGISITLTAQVNDESPKPPPPPPPPPKVVLSKYVPPTKELKEFYKRNPDVVSLYWKSEEDIVVVLKDKTEFVYNMKNEKEKNAFEEKYGATTFKMPPPPPPLPPPPPPPPSKKVS